MKKTVLIVIAWIILVPAIAAAGVYAMVVGVNRSEVVECVTWQKQAQEYPHFYILRWQREQCDAHHIIVGAFVKDPAYPVGK